MNYWLAAPATSVPTLSILDGNGDVIDFALSAEELDRIDRVSRQVA